MDLGRGTRSVRVVEGKQARLRFLVADVAALALEALRKPHLTRASSVNWVCRRSFVWAGIFRRFEDDFAGFPKTDLRCINDAGAGICRDRNAVHQHEYRFRKVDIQQ